MSFFDAPTDNQNPFVNQNQGGYGITNDPNSEWNSLQQECYQTVSKISSETSSVRRMISKIGSPADGIEFRSQIQKKLHHIKQLSTTTTSNIKTLQRMCNETQDNSVRSDRKIIFTKLSKDFSDYLQAYGKLSKEWVDKEKHAIPAPKQPTFSSQNRFNSEIENEEKIALLAADRQQLNLVEREIDFQDDIIADREAGILEIQKDMYQVNDMFKDMNQIVIEQGALVDSIENHIEHARFDVEKGVEEIVEAKTYQKKANSKTKYIICLLLFIIAVIVVIVILSVFVFGN